MNNQTIIAKLPGPNSLLRLPREIRDMIYSFVLQGSYKELRLPGRLSERLHILRTCGQVSEEAVTVLYRENRFRLEAEPDVGTNLNMFPMTDSALDCQETIDALQNIKIVMDDGLGSGYEHSLGPCHRLRKLDKRGTMRKSCHIDIDYAAWWRPYQWKKFINSTKASSLSTFQMVTFELVYSDRYPEFEAMRGYIWTKAATVAYMAVFPEHRQFVYEILKEGLKVNLGDGQIETTGVSQILMFTPGNSLSRSTLG